MKTNPPLSNETHETQTPGPVGPGAMDCALQLAQLGYHVFPVVKNGKTPAIKKFPELATRDPEQLCQQFGKNPGRNIGISTTSFGDDEALVVVDIDNKNDKCGDETIIGLEMQGFDFPPTAEQSSPSGGRHLIYRVPMALKQGANVLGPGVDIRSRGGYIVAAPSVIDGRCYRRINDRPPAPAPEWLVNRLGVARERDALTSEPVPGVDPVRAMARAVEYLKTAPASIEGQGGDHNAFKVAARCKDFGLTAEETLNAMLEHWNDRCEPTWEIEELKTKVRNAFGYGKDRPGAAAPEAVFTVVEKPAGESDDDGSGTGGAVTKSPPARLPAPVLLTFDGGADIMPPPMRVKGVLPFSGVGFIGGQSGAGKSFLACHLAVCVASGEPFFGRKVKERCGVLYIAAEGGATIAARILAARKTTAPEADGLPIAMGTSCPDLRAKGGWEWLAALIEAATEWMRARFGLPLGLIIIDTLGAALGMDDENSNAEANAIVRDLRALADATETMVLAVAHYGKTAETGLRGASAWRGGADVILSVMADRNETTGAASNRRLSLAKSRDGVEGPISGFELAEFRLGVDEDLQSVTTCTIRPVDAPAASPGAKLNPPERSYLAAMAALANKSELIRLDDGREIAALDRETIRTEFNAGWSTGGDARRKAFRNGENRLVNSGVMLRREVEGRMMIWRA